MSSSTDWVEVPLHVQKEQAGQRLDAFLAARLGRQSRANARRLIENGLVHLARRAPKAAARLAQGETVLVRYPRAVEPPLAHETLPILYQDDAIAVISKPSGVLSHPTDKILLNTVTHLLSRQLERAVHLAHRLDRETSGTMVLALNPGAARGLYEQFVARTVRKEYLAVVFGETSWTQIVVDAPLGDHGGDIRVRRAVGGENGQSAVTALRRLTSDGRISLVSASPRTGRLHQIRAHLAHIGHPVLGDKLYCGDGEVYMKAVNKKVTREDLDLLGADRQLLHAWRLSFAHPTDGRQLSFIAPVPDDFPLRPQP